MGTWSGACAPHRTWGMKLRRSPLAHVLMGQKWKSQLTIPLSLAIPSVLGKCLPRESKNGILPHFLVDSVDCLLDGECLFVSDWFLSFTFFCKFSCYPWLVDDVGSITSPVWIVVHCVRVSQPSRLWARVAQPFLLPCFRGPLCGHCWQVLVWARHIMESQTRMMSYQSFEEMPPRECLLLVGKSCTEPMALNVHAVSYLKSSFTGCLGKMESSICRPGTDML